MKKALMIFFLLFSFSSSVFAAPAINTVSGTIAEGSDVTISGSGFGSGPHVILFDDFQKGTNGQQISITSNSAQVGNWSSGNFRGHGTPAYSTAYYRSGTQAMRVDFNRDGGNNDSTPLMNMNLGGVTEMFYAYWMLLPTNYDVPGTNNTDGPNWKMSWLYGDSFPKSDYLWVLLSNDLPDTIAGHELSAGPGGDDNDSPSRYSGNWFNSGLTKGTWQRHDGYFRGSATGAATGAASLHITKPTGQFTICNVNNVLTMHSGELWHNWNLPGYGRHDTNAHVWYDDVYVATGPNCRARVEIGNNPSYTACSNLAIFTPTTWSASSITAKTRLGSFSNGQQAYLFITNASGVTHAGYPVTIGNVPEPPPPPPPCEYTINPVSATYDYLVHDGAINISATDSSCTYTATSSVNWITITGTETGVVNYRVAQNELNSERMGTITVAGLTFAITQGGKPVEPPPPPPPPVGPCSYIIDKTSANYSGFIHFDNVKVTAGSTCAWTAVSNVPWIQVIYGSSGTGSGVAVYWVRFNFTGKSRTGTITIGENVLTITQESSNWWFIH